MKAKDKIVSGFSKAKDWIWDDGLKPAMITMKDFVVGIWDTMVDKIKSGFRTVVNFFIDIINKAIWAHNKIPFRDDIEYLPKLEDAEGSIPKMAKGGVVTKPTLAMIGEAGPEAVVPLSAASNALGGGRNEKQEINIYLDGRKLERFVINRFEHEVRLRGAR